MLHVVLLFPLNSQKLSPVCSIYVQSQKLAKCHGVKSGSRFFGSLEAFLRVTVGHGKFRATANGRMEIGCQGIAVAIEGFVRVQPPTSSLSVETFPFSESVHRGAG